MIQQQQTGRSLSAEVGAILRQRGVLAFTRGLVRAHAFCCRRVCSAATAWQQMHARWDIRSSPVVHGGQQKDWSSPD